MQRHEAPSVLSPVIARTITFAIVIAIGAASLTLSGCVTKRRIYDSSGVLVDEQMVPFRPFSN